jgi:flagellar hook-associated protein 1 FlgK
MGGLNTSLLIGLQALEANQGALDATSNNIANSNTTGYTREVAQFSENQQTVSGNDVTGGGVSLDAVKSIRDELLNLQVQQQTSLQKSADAQSSILDQIQTSFTTTGGDIASELTGFSTSLTQLSASPTSTADKQDVIDSGKNLASAFNSTANELTSAQSEADGTVTSTVSQINTLTAQIAKLNGQVGSVPAGENGGTVEDQRDQLVQQLSGLVGISITQSGDGETITTANGSALVVGSQSYNLQTKTGSDGMQQVIDSNGKNITASIQGGTLGGSIEVRDQTISGMLTQLNTLASQFATAFNSAQAEGTDSNGDTGTAFFTVPSNSNHAAAGISVAISDPSKIAISSDGSSNSNGNVANLSAALTTKLPSGQTAADAYASLVSEVGNAASDATTQSTAIGKTLTQLTDQQSSVSSVSIDEETTNLERYQTAYEAASRIISTIQVLNNAILNMGSSTSF